MSIGTDATVEAHPTPPGPPARRAVTTGRVRAPVAALVGVLLLLPPIVAVAALAGRPWHPVDDFAVLDLRLRDVFSVHTPLTGFYSRYFNHPGPLMFWPMGVLSALAGHAPWATRIAGAVLEGVALMWLVVATARRDLRMLLAAATVTGLTYFALAGWFFRQTWNPHVALISFLLFVFLALLVATGSFRQLISLSIVGTFLVQTHVAYTGMVVVATLWALAMVVVDTRRAGRPPARWQSTVAISAAVWIASWIPPVVDVFVRPPGNLGKIVRYYTRGSTPHLGLTKAAGLMAAEFRPVPPWLHGHEHLQVFTGFSEPASLGWLLVPCALLIVGWLAARRTRSTSDARMVVLAALLFVLTIVSIARADQARGYVFYWRIPVAAFIVVASVWSVARLAAPLVPRLVRWMAASSAVALVAAASVTLVAAVPSAGSTLLDAREPALRQVMRQVERHPPHGVVLVRFVGTSDASLFDGVVNALARDGVDVRVNPDLARAFGAQRAAKASQATFVWYVTEQGSFVLPYLTEPGARLIATTSPLPAAEEAELSRLQQEIRAELTRAGRPALADDLDNTLLGFQLTGVPGLDHAAVDRIAALNEVVQRRGGCRCAIVSVPARDVTS